VTDSECIPKTRAFGVNLSLFVFVCARLHVCMCKMCKYVCHSIASPQNLGYHVVTIYLKDKM